MGGRYWITGVQLGMLQSLQLDRTREALVKEIIKKQFIGEAPTNKEGWKIVSVQWGKEPFGRKKGLK